MWTVILWVFGGFLAINILAIALAPLGRHIPRIGRSLGALAAASILAFPIAGSFMAIQGSTDRDAFSALLVLLTFLIVAVAWVIIAVMRQTRNQP